MLAQPLSTVDQVIKELGGLTAAANLVGVSPQAAWNWSDRGIFPPEHFLLMTSELERRGKSALPELWGQRESEAAAQ